MGLEVPVRLESIEQYIIQKHRGFRYLELSEIQELDQLAELIVADIEEAWPVDTSTSRDAFRYELMTGGQVGFTIYNDVDYVEYIVEKGSASVENGGTPIIDIIIPQVISDNRELLLAQMRTAVDIAEAAYVEPTPGPTRRRRVR
jgi:hypothetical protein